MRETAVARVYAETLLETAQDRGVVDSVAAEAEALREALDDTPRLREFLASPRLSPGEKKGVLRAALRDRFSEVLLRFLGVVIERGRQELLDDILAEFRSLVEEARQQQALDVTSAVPLADALRGRLRETFARVTGRHILLRETVDPRLLGGLVVQLGDTRIDGSLRTRLDNLRERMLRGGRAAAAE